MYSVVKKYIMTGLYIHIPFCVSRCRYCDFYKETTFEREQVQRFLASLENELRRLPKSFAPDTVFIGGGTPTVLDSGDYMRMLEGIHRQINLSNVIEFSSEANPGTLTKEKLMAMRQGGINRVSIGVQSFNDKALRLLGRIHNAQTAIDGYHMLRDAGFDNVNIDLIQSIPGMKPIDVLMDAQQLVDLSPEHISYYNLIYEPGTPITADRDAGRLAEPDEDEEADNYFAVKDLLENAGYTHYEISNFSKPGKPCNHNVLYWQGGEYFGCGPAAYSHWDGIRFGNVSDLTGYCDRISAGEKPFDEVEKLTSEDKARETLVMWLRLLKGVDFNEFKDVSGFSVEELCGDSLTSMIEEGLIKRAGNRIALSRDALFVSNGVFSELV